MSRTEAQQHPCLQAPATGHVPAPCGLRHNAAGQAAPSLSNSYTRLPDGALEVAKRTVARTSTWLTARSGAQTVEFRTEHCPGQPLRKGRASKPQQTSQGLPERFRLERGKVFLQMAVLTCAWRAGPHSRISSLCLFRLKGSGAHSGTFRNCSWREIDRGLSTEKRTAIRRDACIRGSNLTATHDALKQLRRSRRQQWLRELYPAFYCLR